MKTGIDWDRVRAELDAQPWEESDGQLERMVFLGTVFALYPSGKYYTPFACSNVEPCPACNGTGTTPVRGKRRQLKKWESKIDRCRTMAHKRRMVGKLERLQSQGWYRAYWWAYKRVRPSGCPQCGGLGSREA